MPQQLGDIWTNVLYRKLIVTGIILLVWTVLRLLVDRTVIRYLPEDSPHILRIRKASGYLLTLATSLVIFGVWVQSLGDLSVALGIWPPGWPSHCRRSSAAWPAG